MNEHSAKYDRVKQYYEDGLWNASMVMDAVGRWITEAEGKEIIGGALRE